MNKFFCNVIFIFPPIFLIEFRHYGGQPWTMVELVAAAFGTSVFCYSYLLVGYWSLSEVDKVSGVLGRLGSSIVLPVFSISLLSGFKLFNGISLVDWAFIGLICIFSFLFSPGLGSLVESYVTGGLRELRRSSPGFLKFRYDLSDKKLHPVAKISLWFFLWWLISSGK